MRAANGEEDAAMTLMDSSEMCATLLTLYSTQEFVTIAHQTWLENFC